MAAGELLTLSMPHSDQFRLHGMVCWSVRSRRIRGRHQTHVDLKWGVHTKRRATGAAVRRQFPMPLRGQSPILIPARCALCSPTRGG